MRLTILYLLIFINALVPNLHSQWIPQLSPTSEDLIAVQFIDQNRGWIVGNEIILSTDDGGIHWHDYQIPGVYLIDLFAVNDEIAWAVGTTMYGLTPGRAIIMQTSDGGDTWALIDSAQTGYFGSIFFYDSQFGWITGAEGTSTDSYGMVYRTTDSGISWHRTEVGSVVSLTDAFFISPAVGWSVSIDAYIYVTTDSGLTWDVSDRATNDTFNVPLRAITFTNPDSGWVVGGLSGNSVVGRTTDGGETWTFDYMFTGSTFRDCAFVNPKKGWIAGGLNFAPKIYFTDDGSLNWVEQSHGLGADNTTILEGISMIDENNGWIVGRNGTILKSLNAGVTGVEVFTGTSPYTFNLFQNYPNPFNPSTIIPFFLHESGWVTIKVYDLLGREIQTLADEFMPAGTHQVHFNPPEPVSGVYLYQLRINNSTISKSMVLSK
jgi:photosystem II stability/assembly factor-like uncharacterized protein